MVTATVKFALLLRPAHITVLGWVFVLALWDQKLELVDFLVREQYTHFSLSHIESFAYRFARKELCIEWLREANCCFVENWWALLAAYDVRYITLLEYFPYKLRHACSDEYDLYLGYGLLENFTQLALADKFSVTIFSLKQQVTHIFFLHQFHTCGMLIESMAGYMEDAGPFSDHLNELIFCCNGLLKSDLLIRKLDSFNNPLFLLLEL